MARDSGPAPEGAVLPQDVLDHLPIKVGDFSLTSDGSDGSLIEYTNDDGGAVDLNATLMSSSTKDLKAEIADEYTRAGTGGCEVPKGSDSLTCYLALESGTLNVNADSATSRDGSAVTFVDQFTEQVGTE